MILTCRGFFKNETNNFGLRCTPGIYNYLLEIILINNQQAQTYLSKKNLINNVEY